MNLTLMAGIVEVAENQLPCENIVASELQNCQGETYRSTKQMKKIVSSLLDGEVPENLKNCGTFGSPIDHYIQLAISSDVEQISSNGNLLRYCR